MVLDRGLRRGAGPLVSAAWLTMLVFKKSDNQAVHAEHGLHVFTSGTLSFRAR